MARLRCCRLGGVWPSSPGCRRRWCSHSSSPLAPSSACTRSPGLAMYITPPYTIGVVCCDPSASAQLQTSRSWPALSAVISSSGLWPQASRVRRQWSQSPGSGFCSTASVTGLKSSSACALAVSAPPAVASARTATAHSRRPTVRPSSVRRANAAPAHLVIHSLRVIPPRAAACRPGSYPSRHTIPSACPAPGRGPRAAGLLYCTPCYWLGARLRAKGAWG